jgi:hypothetical protein
LIVVITVYSFFIGEIPEIRLILQKLTTKQAK